MSIRRIDLEQMIVDGWIQLGRGDVISKKDIDATPGQYPIYSSARLNNGKFGEYGHYMFDEELITWSVDGGGNFFYRPKHRFSVTNVGGTLKVLKPEELDYKYMYYVLSHMHERLLFDWTLKAHPSVIRRLYTKIPIPPLPEQRRIAAILDKADALRAKRREAIAKLDQLLQSVFLDMFGDPVTNPKGWQKKSLSNVGRVQTGGTPPSSMTGMFDGPVPFVTPGDLGGLVDLARRTVTLEGARMSRVAPAGSTLVCCIGATIGKMGFARFDCAFNQQINAVTWSDHVLPKYGYYALRRLAPDIAHRGASTTLPILKKSEFEKLSITVPTVSAQKKFSEAAEASENQMRALGQSNEQLEVLFHSLQAEMFASGSP